MDYITDGGTRPSVVPGKLSLVSDPTVSLVMDYITDGETRPSVVPGKFSLVSDPVVSLVMDYTISLMVELDHQLYQVNCL